MMGADQYMSTLSCLIDRVPVEKVRLFARYLRITPGTIYIIGNGGSASNAEHAANDFMKVAGKRAIALTALAPLTAYANDCSYNKCFSGPLEVLLKPEDTVLVLSVSGSSPNICEAIEVARTRLSCTLLLMGIESEENAVMRKIVENHISVFDSDYGRVETVHQAICHVLAKIMKEGNDGR